MSTLPPPKSFPVPAPDEPPTTPPRQSLASVQTPLLRRLSVNFLSFASSSTVTASPTVDKTHMSIPPALSPNSSSPRPSISKPSAPPPKPNVDEESPEEYLSRVLEVVSKADVATILASSGDDFHTRALRAYISSFEFSRDPLDVAIRRLLMYVGLPRETQQIDRVMEAFAARYREDHVDLYVSDDHPYILAFSLIMLHTDAFNKSNKRKMSKADYVKNTRLPGVPSEVLDCFYDNTIFAPFIFIEEDQLEAAVQRGLQPETPSRPSTGLGAPTGMAASSISILTRSNKVDPYYLITKNLLDPLRVNIETYVPLENPYSYRGSQGIWNEEELRGAFARAGVIEVSSEQRRLSTPFFALGVGGFSSPYPGLYAAPDHGHPVNEDVSLKVTKVGLLHRRDVVLEGGKRVSSRKWKDWSVILTGSQLLLFRDPVWAAHLSGQMGAGSTQLLMPPASLLKPNEIFTVKDALAIYDKTYDKTDNTFTLILHDGRQLLLKATDETDMDQWISRINYASAFKTAGIRMRPLAISGKDVQLMGVAAAASHLRDLKTPKAAVSSPRVRTWDNRSSAEFVDRPIPPPEPSPVPATSRSAKPGAGAPQIAFEVPTAPAIDGAQQFKATFDQVKADLAAGRSPSMDDYTSKPEGRPRAVSLESAIQAWPTSPDETETKPSSRAQLIRSKIKALDARIATSQSQLDDDLRLVRNIGILTPFQRTTRDRLEMVVQGVARKVMFMRLELEKFVCHREVLAHDLVAEVRDWHRTKSLALRAATETLQKRREASGGSRMALSLHLDSPSPPTSSSSGQSVHAHNRPLSSSTSASFHSALDHSWTNNGIPNRAFEGAALSDSPLGTPLTDEGHLGSSSSYSFHAGESPTTMRTDSTLSLHPPRAVVGSVPDSSEDLTHGHERFVTAKESFEEAEEWNKTRAAKRVSLVKVPSDLRISRTQTKSPTQARPQEQRGVPGMPTGKVSRSPIPFFSEASYVSSNLR
ncbi:hypothetical protein OF83DRAFT_1050859 [Amylostereum chailletii]|nr:hypothetical protein OF83DRAFT_1050859 [Amylostereum chailletii]